MIQVPKERIEHFADEYGLSFNEASDQYHAVAKHLAANPIVPTVEQMDELCGQYSWLDRDSVRFGARAWQRRMFLAPEIEQSVSLRPGKYIVEVGGGFDPRVTPYEYACVAVPDEFMACDSCRAKPGSPTLCVGCLHNRQAIEDMRKASR